MTAKHMSLDLFLGNLLQRWKDATTDLEANMYSTLTLVMKMGNFHLKQCVLNQMNYNKIQSCGREDKWLQYSLSLKK